MLGEHRIGMSIPSFEKLACCNAMAITVAQKVAPKRFVREESLNVVDALGCWA